MGSLLVRRTPVANERCRQFPHASTEMRRECGDVIAGTA